MDQVSRIVLHQASRVVVEGVAKALDAPEKLEFFAEAYGNTASSSIPIVLGENVTAEDRRVVLSGFGTGLSWASTVLTRI
jgi:3-oxoacyl-[acyl-carrier-protein] synthase-3